MRADAAKNRAHLLAVAREVVAERGAGASLREVARRAAVGLGTLYRHFPTREALMEALLRTRLDELADVAGDLERSEAPAQALAIWFAEGVVFVRHYNGVVNLMAAALADPQSPLHASCSMVRAAGARLLARAQAAHEAPADLSGLDLFALMGALGWVGDQPAFADRADHLAHLIVKLLLQVQKGSPEA